MLKPELIELRKYALSEANKFSYGGMTSMTGQQQPAAGTIVERAQIYYNFLSDKDNG